MYQKRKSNLGEIINRISLRIRLYNSIYIRNYKRQRNYVVNLNKNAKFEYFSRFDRKDGKPFWIDCKPYFSNKHSKTDNNIVLNEDGELI